MSALERDIRMAQRDAGAFFAGESGMSMLEHDRETARRIAGAVFRGRIRDEYAGT